MRILLVEDDTQLRTQLRTALQGAGYTVDEADNGRDAQFLGDTEAVDAVVLDLGLPVVDGLTVLKRWRAEGRNMPVLILTARDNWHEKVAGIDAGADDYLVKPFGSGELMARVRAQLRRSQRAPGAEASPVIQFGPISIDLARRTVERRTGDDDSEALELLLDLLGVRQVADLTGIAGALDLRDLLLAAARPLDREAAGHEVVAAVAVLDLDDVARGTEARDVLSEDELHVRSCSCQASARGRRVGKECHLAGVLDGTGNQALFLEMVATMRAYNEAGIDCWRAYHSAALPSDA